MMLLVIDIVDRMLVLLCSHVGVENSNMLSCGSHGNHNLGEIIIAFLTVQTHLNTIILKVENETWSIGLSE